MELINSIHADVAPDVFWMRIEQIWIRIEHPLNVFKIKMIIWMSLELKHKIFKDQYEIKERVKKN
jgi:hypothetical protein